MENVQIDNNLLITGVVAIVGILSPLITSIFNSFLAYWTKRSEDNREDLRIYNSIKREKIETFYEALSDFFVVFQLSDTYDKRTLHKFIKSYSSVLPYLSSSNAKAAGTIYKHITHQSKSSKKEVIEDMHRMFELLSNELKN